MGRETEQSFPELGVSVLSQSWISRWRKDSRRANLSINLQKGASSFYEQVEPQHKYPIRVLEPQRKFPIVGVLSSDLNEEWENRGLQKEGTENGEEVKGGEGIRLQNG